MARLRAARQLTEEQRRELMTTQAALTALTKHPSWPNLVARVDEKVQRTEREALANVLSPKGIEPAHAGYLRGFRAGVRYMVDICEGAEDRLETILRQVKES